MLLRRTLATLFGTLLVMAGVTAASEAKAESEVTMATLAPEASPWGKVFTAWASALERKTDKKLKLKWYFGSQGDEETMIGKVRSGQLSGAAVTSVGLSAIHKNILAMQMPGLFSKWAAVDKARDALMPEFEAGIGKEGFKLIGSGDVGLARTMSKGSPVKSPGDMKKMKVYYWKADPTASVVASVIGYTGVPSSVPELLPALTSKRINCLTVPALAATQLQWWAHLDHVNEDVAGAGIGGLVVSAKVLEGLPGDVRETFLKTGKKAGSMLTERIREEDAKAYKMMTKRMTVVKLSDSERARWKSTFKKIRRELAKGTYPSKLVSKLEGYAE
jgi:TRAP-type C4-dicarboxylate transport system substrate-binding protein